MRLFRSFSSVSGLTLISRILGLLRDVVLMAKFGASPAMDAFFVAFRLPNMLRRLFAEGAFAQAFVPILARMREVEGDGQARQLVGKVATLMAVVLLFVSVLGVMLSPYLVYLIASGYDYQSETGDLTVQLVRLTFPYILFISLTSLASSVLNTWGNFVVPAITPALLNVCFIFSALYLSPLFDQPILSLAIGVLLGGVAQLIFQVPSLWKLGLIPKFNWSPKDSGVLQILRKMGPAIFGVSVAQVSLLINTSIATYLQPGSVSWLSVADRLMEFPVGLLGVAMATIMLPSLSSAVAQPDRRDYELLLSWGIRLLLIVLLPSVVGLVLLSPPIISLLFVRGQFGADDALMTNYAFWGYGVGLLPIVMIKLFAPVFYANQDTKTPVKIAVVALISTQILNFIFLITFPHSLKHAGLALAISFGAWINMILLIISLRRRSLFISSSLWRPDMIRGLLATIPMAAFIIWSSDYFGLINRAGIEGLALLFLIVLLGAIIYFASAQIMGVNLKSIIKFKRIQ